MVRRKAVRKKSLRKKVSIPGTFKSTAPVRWRSHIMKKSSSHKAVKTRKTGQPLMGTLKHKRRIVLSG